jgi:hypothetical protein
MTVYARVANGVVAELFTMPANSPFTISQMFNAALVWADVTNVSPQPQVGWVATPWSNNKGYTFAAPPAPPAPTPAQQAQAALTAGLAVNSTSTPALNGTYAIDPTSQMKINSVALYVAVNQKFPGGATSYPWLTMSGTASTFPSIAEFDAFATAVADYVAQLDMIIATGAGTLPASSVTIA